MNFLFKNEIGALICFGLSGVLVFFSYTLFPVSAVLFLCGILLALGSIAHAVRRVFSWPGKDKFLVVCMAVFGLSHAIGILLPETGFDAVWYHLPITQVFLDQHRNLQIPELYQSAMPRLGSFIFAVPFFFGGEMGVKILCYLVTLLLPLLLYNIARHHLPRTIALLVALLFFSFHTVAWQASSAYVDQFRAAFELAAIWIVLKTLKRPRIPLLILIGILLGFSLSLKLVALFFLPAFILFIWKEWGGRSTLVATAIILLVASPWYLQAYFWTGNPVYPLFQLLDGKQQLSGLGVGSWAEWILLNVPKFVFLPFYLTMHRESFTSLIYAFSAPFLIVSLPIIRKNIGSLSLFTLAGFVVWFAFPPLSVRYALTYFATALIICMYAIWNVIKNSPQARRLFYFVCALNLIVALSLRLGSNAQAIPYLIGKESRDAYIQKHAQGIAKGPIELWYLGYWKSWNPSQKSETHP